MGMLEVLDTSLLRTPIWEFSNIPVEHTPDPQLPVYDSEFLSFGGEKGMHGVCSSLVCWGSLRTKVVVRSLNPTQPFSWICLRWVFMDCTMVNHHQTTNLGKYVSNFFQAFSQQIQADPPVFWEWWVYSWQDSLLNAWIPHGYFLIALFFCLLVILIRILPMGWKSKWKKSPCGQYYVWFPNMVGGHSQLEFHQTSI